MREWRVGDYRIGFRIGLGTPFMFWYRGRLKWPLKGRRLAVMLPGVQFFVDHYPGAPDWWGRLNKGEFYGELTMAVVTDLDRDFVKGDLWVDLAEPKHG